LVRQVEVVLASRAALPGGHLFLRTNGAEGDRWRLELREVLELLLHAVHEEARGLFDGWSPLTGRVHGDLHAGRVLVSGRARVPIVAS
jgi:predicted trehalose synthase